VPVAGGGGNTAIVFPTPTNGSTVTVTLPAPAEIGTIYTVAGTPFFSALSGQVAITPTLLPGQDGAIFLGLNVSNPDDVNSVIRNDTLTLDVSNQTTFYIIYLGEIESGGTLAAYQFTMYNFVL
jgi:hypothetical protein